jgi:hypothetical protein
VERKVSFANATDLESEHSIKSKNKISEIFSPLQKVFKNTNNTLEDENENKFNSQDYYPNFTDNIIVMRKN